MGKLKNWISSPSLLQLAALATIILAIPTFFGWIINLLHLAEKVSLTIITSNTQRWFNMTVISAIVFLVFSYRRITKRFTVGFSDQFKGDLRKNWEFRGDWGTVKPGVLYVRNSGVGGLTKVGSLWENYVFEFETKIVNKCSSWIVRGQDLNNYFMFQCRRDVIVPHLRVAVPKVRTDKKSQSGDELLEVSYNVAWQIWPSKPHNSKLDDWAKVKIEVRGPDVNIWIGGELAYHSDNLIPYPMGRVGFRNNGDEEAHFKNVRVRLTS